MEKEENKLKFEDILELMEKISLSIEMTREKQDSIDNMLEEIYDQPLSMKVEDKKKEIESEKEEKAEFDEMTKGALINAKKLVLQLREESEKEYQEALLKTSKKQMDINKKLASIKKTLLEKEEFDKIPVAEEKAKNSLEKANSEMKEFQDRHFELRKNLELQEKDIWDFAVELGVEKEIDSVSLEDEVIDNENINIDNTNEDKQIKRIYKLRNTTFEDVKETEETVIKKTETEEPAIETETRKTETSEIKVESNKDDLKALFVNGILKRLEELEKIDEEKWTSVEDSKYEMIWNELGWNSDMRQAFCEACEVSDEVKKFLDNTDFTQSATLEEKVDLIDNKLKNISLREGLYVLIKTGLFEEMESKKIKRKPEIVREEIEVVSNTNPKKENYELDISSVGIGKDKVEGEDDLNISFEGMDENEREDGLYISFEGLDENEREDDLYISFEAIETDDAERKEVEDVVIDPRISAWINELDELDRIEDKDWSVSHSERYRAVAKGIYESGISKEFCEACKVSDKVKNIIDTMDLTQSEKYGEILDDIAKKDLSRTETLYVLAKTGLFEECLKREGIIDLEKTEITDENKPGQSKPVETKTNVTGENKPGQTKPVEIKTNVTGENKPGQSKPVETKTNVTGENKPGQSKPVETNTTGEKKTEKIFIEFDAKEGTYTLIKGVSKEVKSSHKKIKEEADKEQKFKTYMKIRYGESIKRYVDEHIAYLLYKDDQISNTNNLDMYVRALSRMIKFPENINLTYNMDGVYSKKYTEEQSNNFMNYANHLLARKLGVVNKGPYTKFLEKHDRIRHIIAKLNNITNRKNSKTKLLTAGIRKRETELYDYREQEQYKEVQRINSISSLKELREFELAQKEEGKVWSDDAAQETVEKAIENKKRELTSNRRKNLAKIFKKQIRNNQVDREESDHQDEVSIGEIGINLDEFEYGTENASKKSINTRARDFIKKVNVPGLDIEKIKQENKVEPVKRKGENTK